MTWPGTGWPGVYRHPQIRYMTGFQTLLLLAGACVILFYRRICLGLRGAVQELVSVAVRFANADWQHG